MQCCQVQPRSFSFSTHPHPRLLQHVLILVAVNALRQRCAHTHGEGVHCRRHADPTPGRNPIFRKQLHDQTEVSSQQQSRRLRSSTSGMGKLLSDAEIQGRAGWAVAGVDRTHNLPTQKHTQVCNKCYPAGHKPIQQKATQTRISCSPATLNLWTGLHQRVLAAQFLDARLRPSAACCLKKSVVSCVACCLQSPLGTIRPQGCC